MCGRRFQYAIRDGSDAGGKRGAQEVRERGAVRLGYAYDLLALSSCKPVYISSLRSPRPPPPPAKRLTVVSRTLPPSPNTTQWSLSLINSQRYVHVRVCMLSRALGRRTCCVRRQNRLSTTSRKSCRRYLYILLYALL